MSDIFEGRRAKEKIAEAIQYASKNKTVKKESFNFSNNEINALLKVILPQNFDMTTSAIRGALYQIDPSWEKGQFENFSEQFRAYHLRSIFTRRFLLDSDHLLPLTEEQILDKILEASQNMDDDTKAAFYGTLLSEYILLCPKERFPKWLKSYKLWPSWMIISHIHDELWKMFYW